MRFLRAVKLTHENILVFAKIELTIQSSFHQVRERFEELGDELSSELLFLIRSMYGF